MSHKTLGFTDRKIVHPEMETGEFVARGKTYKFGKLSIIDTFIFQERTDKRNQISLVLLILLFLSLSLVMIASLLGLV